MHFVLVHDICFGAWSWCKLIGLLLSSGHTAEAIDLGASGVHPLRFNELWNINDYAKPLMEKMAGFNAKVVLVGHGFGGVIVALAMETFPDKVSTAIFVAAFMPATTIPLADFTSEYVHHHPNTSYLDSHIKTLMNSPNLIPSIKYGPNYMATKLFRRCSPKDFTLSTLLVREGGWFFVQLHAEELSAQRYGSVKKVFIRCSKDLWMNSDFENIMFQGSPGVEIKVLEGADHMPMLCKPMNLCIMLLQAAGTVDLTASEEMALVAV